MRKTSVIAVVVLVVIIAILGYVAYNLELEKDPKFTAKNITYVCKDNKLIGAKFYIPIQEESSSTNKPKLPGGSVDITLSDGRSLHLTQTISASGVRYANEDETFVFWSKGTSAIVLENDKVGSFVDCEEGTKKTPESTSIKKFLYDNQKFSIILPRFTLAPQLSRTDSYLVDEAHSYGLIPGETILGVQFTIPSSLVTGTNLAKDSYLSIEHIDNAKKCSADMFLEGKPAVTQFTEKGLTYTVASSTGAAAGNRYEETVYAQQNKNTCYGVRYFIHYGVFENYPTGSIKRFDKASLLEQFNQIRLTLVIKK